MFYVLAAVLLFLEGIGVINKPMILWALCLIAVGLACGGPSWSFWRSTPKP